MEIHLRRPLVEAQPPVFSGICSLCGALCSRYPRLRPAILGRSVLGREIPALCLSQPGGGAASPKRVLLAAGFHAQEGLTALVCLRLCEEICLALETGVPLYGLPVNKALSGRQLWFVPLVNPDGLEIARLGSRAAGELAPAVAAAGGDTPGLWQANARGVDINHNFNAGWEEMQALAAKNGKTQPGPRQYAGPFPESEPETAALTDLCRRYAFRHVAALHSQGEEIYWDYPPYTPPQSRVMAQVLGAASGYRVTHPAGLAAHGGFKDWFIRCYHRPGFTIELGKGRNPLPPSDLEPIWEKAGEMLTLAAFL